LKPNNLRITPLRPSAVPGKTIGTSVKPAVTPVQASPAQTTPVPRKREIAGEERRRNNRVLLRVRANVHVALQGKPEIFEAVTLSVSNHGALVLLKQSLPLEARLVLEHSATKERVVCKVARIAREMPEGFHIPLEFDAPAPNFWRIAFPPTDWRPSDDS